MFEFQIKSELLRAEIVYTVKLIQQKCGSDRAVICATDCLLQWNKGEIRETLSAWNRCANNVRSDGPTPEELVVRNGLFVPPL